MYFSNCLVLNSGPISQLELSASFNEQGEPKPIILVGTNGSGKTGALSTIADALAEIAAQHFVDALPEFRAGHSYLRLLGGRNLRLNQTFELSALKFVHHDTNFFVRSKAGKISTPSLRALFSSFDPVAALPEEGNHKLVEGNLNAIADIFTSGAYAFFPESRFELPHWANTRILERDPEWDFSSRISNRLAKPIVVQTALQGLKQWLLDVIAEQLIDFNAVMRATDLDQLKTDLLLSQTPAIANARGLNEIFSIILRQQVRLVRVMGGNQSRRLGIASGDNIIIPSVDHLSAGQSSLLSIFGTLAKYGGVPRTSVDQIEGIAIIDEIEDHLHADLQHDALPLLIKLFPRVQFILSSHSPLFLLGMREVFGDDGYTIIELPSGLTISPERFSEFEKSLSLFRATEAFESVVQQRLRSSQSPLVMSEGQTDPVYLKTAAELLGFTDIVATVEFDWVGAPDPQGAQGGGKSHLDDALKFLKNNPQFQTRKIVFLYDPETRKPAQDIDNLHVRTLPQNTSATRLNGIENLLPAHVFESQFFENKMMGKGDDKGPVPVLQKVPLCEHLCNVKRDRRDFEAFRNILEDIQAILCPRA